MNTARPQNLLYVSRISARKFSSILCREVLLTVPTILTVVPQSQLGFLNVREKVKD